MADLTGLEAARELQRTLVLVLDLCGTFAFAISGAMAGVRRRLDLFGILVLSFAAASFGGITRDLVIGATPPAALVDWRYLTVASGAGLFVFLWPEAVERLRHPVRLLDAVGLAFFAVAGAQKALAFGMSPLMAALLGMLTGIGGGIARDVLLAEVPGVLRSEFYALAALAGAGVVAASSLLGVPYVAGAIAGGVVCFGLRVSAMELGWSLPRARGGGTPRADGDGSAR